MFGNILLLALRELRRNLLRSLLTILGIVIGVAAVIVMVTLGSGATAQVSAQIASLGTNLLIVIPGKRMGPGLSSGAVAFRAEDAAAIAREVPGAALVAPTAAMSLTAVNGNQNWSTMVMGVTAEFFAVRNWVIGSGRPFTASEERGGAAVCLLGDTVRTKLFGGQDPIGSQVRLQALGCRVVGLLAAKGQSTMGADQDDQVLMPLRTLQRRLVGNQDVSQIHISVDAAVTTAKAQRDIESLLRERRHLAAGEESDFSVRDMQEIARMLTSTTATLTALLSAVAAVSLLVGGIGIMNIMLVSVTERTREIGIRMAIGAREREVLLQFLVEAVVLASFGGLLGVVLAVVASLGLTRMLAVPFVFDPGIVLIAFGFSAAVGVVFGYMPARKAARLDPIEALRHE